MTDRRDLIPALAALIRAAVYGDRTAPALAERLLPSLGITWDGSLTAGSVEEGLREALGPALDRERLGTALAALEDAADYRREHRDGDCTDCDALPAGQGDGGEKAADGPSAPDLVDRIADVLSEAGYTDARQVFPGGFLITGGPGYATTGSVIVSVPWTDATDGERRRLLARFAEALRDGGLHVTARGRYLEARAMPGEAREW